MLPRWCYVLTFLLTFVSSYSYAEKNLDLFTTQQMVIDQSPEARQDAAVEGLAIVLVRLSGSRTVLQNPEIQAALKRASAYLYQFSYQSVVQEPTTESTDVAESPSTLLVLHFSQAPLEQLLRENGLPLWSSNRPDVLLWTAINDGRQRYVSTDSFIGEQLKSKADDRGLPVVMPILDLDDRQALPVSRLWAMDEGTVRVAASRYGADAVLSGRFSEDRRNWVGSFMLIHQGKTRYLSAKGESQSDVAANIIHQLTDYFAEIYAVIPGVQSDQPVLLQVNNVADFSYYAKIVSYLEKLPLVDTVVVSKVKGTELTIAVSLNTDVERFLQTLSLDKRLIRVNEEKQTSLSVNLQTTPPVAPGQAIGQTTTEVPVLEPPVLEFIWQ